MNRQKNFRHASLEDLKDSFELAKGKYKNNSEVKVTDIYESRISFSFRVFLNGECIVFADYQK
jgi:hypothetical protein